jgi:ribonuclease-3
LYYEWILRRDKIIKVISKIDPEHAASQLHELQQKGLIREPSFEFSETHDKNGNPIWRCTCKLVEAEWPIQESDISKKTAKQKAAAEALSYFIGEEITLNKNKEKK